MSHLSQRLSKLEPGPRNQEYMEEVGLRLMRYGIETRHRACRGELPESSWWPEAEEIYQRWTRDPDFESFERETLANPRYSGEVNAR